jgi:tetratricopeptide (TPR) repeat protein
MTDHVIHEAPAQQVVGGGAGRGDRAIPPSYFIEQTAGPGNLRRLLEDLDQYSIKGQPVQQIIQRGRLHFSRGDLRRAGEEFYKILCVDPEHPAALYWISLIAYNVGQFDRAYKGLVTCVQLHPFFLDACYALASLMYHVGMYEEAVMLYHRTLAIEPKHLSSHVQLGFAALDNGRVDEALDWWRRALAIEPTTPEGLFDRGFVRLALGDLAGGFRDHEARFRMWGGAFAYELTPRWRGKKLGGKSLAVCLECGFGDSIQMLRYLPQLAALGGPVRVSMRPGLIRLARGSFDFPNVTFEPWDPQGEDRIRKETNFWVGEMSLPHYFKTTGENIPLPNGYLRSPDPVRDLGGVQGALKVGIVWAGDPRHARDRLRSCEVEHFAPLFAIPGIEWHSLQVGERAAEGDAFPLVCHEIGDYGETAAIVSALDLVVTVDTSVAHLTGSLGKPVWIMLDCNPDWRWQLERTDSPWYRSARLWRQPGPRDWPGVIARMQPELGRLARERVSRRDTA